MKTLLRLLALLAGLSAVAPARASTYTITVGDNFYSPSTLAIQVGDVVTWQYRGNSMHPTASTTGAWNTFMLDSSNPSYTRTFNAVGTYNYYCTMHGSPGGGMSGSITVTAALPTLTARPVADFLAYPNPASQAVLLQFAPLPAATPGVLQVLDARGAVVRSQPVPAASHELLLRVADLPAGFYLCRLLAGHETVAAQRLLLGQP